eukprot:3840867-Pleurochrysis_carterae.AAC.2
MAEHAPSGVDARLAAAHSACVRMCAFVRTRTNAAGTKQLCTPADNLVTYDTQHVLATVHTDISLTIARAADALHHLQDVRTSLCTREHLDSRLRAQ